MKYTKEEQLNEIMLRGKLLKQRKDKHVTRSLSTGAVLLFFALVTCIGSFGGTDVFNTETDYGSFLLSAETGGYVLTAVIAFVVGVITTVLIKRHKKSKQ